MGIKESALPQKSSVATDDFVRVVGNDDSSYKQLVSDVAKAIIENYTGSSLAGSSQSVKSALDSLNSKKTGTFTPTSGTQNLMVRQCGRVVTINGYITPTLTANTETNIGTVSGVSLPDGPLRFIGGVGAYAYSHPLDVAYLTLATNGNLLINTTVSGAKAVYFTVSYIV